MLVCKIGMWTRMYDVEDRLFFCLSYNNNDQDKTDFKCLSSREKVSTKTLADGYRARYVKQTLLFFSTDPLSVWPVSDPRGQRLKRRSNKSSGEGSQPVRNCKIKVKVNAIITLSLWMFCLQIRHLKLVLLFTKWTSREEKLQRAVRLHLQVSHNFKYSTSTR